MKHLKSLLKLKSQKEVSYSTLPKKLIDELKDEGLIDIKTISGNKKKVYTNEAFMEVYSNLEDIENAQTRAELTVLKVDSKRKKISPQDGLYLNGKCKIEEIVLPISINSAIFLTNIPKIDKDILIVGVENFENLIYFQMQLRYFQDDKILFVFRNSKMLQFIQNIQNRIIYFGDFDLAGINIYINEIKPRNKKIEFFIPDDIEKTILKHGTTKLYPSHYRYRNIQSEDKKIQKLIDFINKTQKTIEQEFFISYDLKE